jgi:Zn-dependent protease with chaperone function
MESRARFSDLIPDKIMHLAIVVLVIAALCYDGANMSPQLTPDTRLVCTLGGMALVVLVARIFTTVVAIAIHRDARGRQAWLHRFELLRKTQAVIWFGVTAGIIFGLDWPTFVRRDCGLASAFLIDELLIMMPVMLPLVLSWCVFYGAYQAAQFAKARTTGCAVRMMRRGAFVGVQARHYFGLIVAPLLVVLACYDAIQLAAPALVEPWRSIIMIFSLACCCAGFPVVLRVVWRMKPLSDGQLRAALDRVSKAMDVKVRDILVWPSEGMVTNAAVTGLWPSMRYVMLSDGLLARMNHDQIAAVYAHELAHARNRHMVLRLAALIAVVAMWHISLDTALATPWLGSMAGAALLLIVTIGLVAVFTGYCRALELQADLCASAGGQATNIATALLTLQSTTDKAGHGWLHPKTDSRVAMIRAAADNPKLAHEFHRRLSGLAMIWILIAALSAMWWLLPA